MPRLEGRIERGPNGPAFRDYYTRSIQQMEQAALDATDKAARKAVTSIRQQMKAARLGRLGNAIGSTSDRAKGRGVKRYGANDFSASGVIFIRSRSPRTLGAIASYTEGAEIRPVRSRWLWIPTDEIPRVTGRERMTPALYRKNGFEQKIGPLTQIRSVNGNPLLVARKVGVNAGGKARQARSLTKRGQPRKGQRLKEFVVAFIGIPRTARTARIDVEAIVRAQVNELPALFEQAMKGRAR